MDNNTVYEWILNSTFTVSARMNSLQSAKDHLSAVLRQGDEVLDLCCGSGFLSFWLEEQGAHVTGVDFAPYMIRLAWEEAEHRHSTVKFSQADIFEWDFGEDRFDLVICFDSISDFPIADFAKLSRKTAGALKHGGWLAVKYVDGISRLRERDKKPEGVYQEKPERITYRVKEYLPELGAMVHTIRNETRGQEYDRLGFIYTPQFIRLAVDPSLVLEKQILLEADQFLNIFRKDG